MACTFYLRLICIEIDEHYYDEFNSKRNILFKFGKIGMSRRHLITSARIAFKMRSTMGITIVNLSARAAAALRTFSLFIVSNDCYVASEA